MKYIHWTFSILLALCSCSQTESVVLPPDPIHALYQKHADEIFELKTAGTPKGSWDSKTSEHDTKKINSLKELNSILAQYKSLPQEEADRYRELFRNSYSTYEYAFELQLSALVFFDEQNRTKDAFLRS